MIQINVTKLSDPSSTWTLDIELTDTIQDIKGKIIAKEATASRIFPDITKVRLWKFMNMIGAELQQEGTVTDYEIGDGDSLSATYTSDITVCGTSKLLANGLYSIYGYDPGGKPVYVRGDEEFFVSYYSDIKRWVIEEWDNQSGGTSFANSSEIDSENAYTPYNESAFSPFNNIGVWEDGLTIHEGNYKCVCDPKFSKFATGNECGEDRFRRLKVLGYI